MKDVAVKLVMVGAVSVNTCLNEAVGFVVMQVAALQPTLSRYTSLESKLSRRLPAR